MAIVTISRGTLSGGQHLAECVGGRLGYRVISREVLAEAANQFGVSQEALAKGLEEAPSFWDRFSIDRQVYLAVVRATLGQLVRQDNVVYHGNAGHLLLQDVARVLRVRVIAPMSFRVKAAMEARGLREREAEEYVRKRDEERVSWTRFLYGVEWRDPSLYDVVFNLEKTNLECACDAIVQMTTNAAFRPTPEDLRQLADLCLAWRIKALLFLNPKIGAAATKINVSVTAGAVSLAGIVPGAECVEQAVTTCHTLPEAPEVNAENLGSHVGPV